MRLNRFVFYTWIILGFNLLVILWGALVRATGSGAGCGNHWPTCNGAVIPLASQTETMIEFTHRLTSGLAFLLVVFLLIWAFRAYPGGHRVRLGAAYSMLFMTIEALVGAILVIFELVVYDASLARTVVMALHLVNTFLLLTALTLTAWWASGGAPLQLKGQGWLGQGMLLGYGGLLLLGASGGATALGDTLFPVTTLAEGLRQDLSPTAHFLVQLRLYHPLIAIVVGAYIILITGMFNASRPTPLSRRIAKIFRGLYFVQLVGGAFNVVLLAPIWMQLFHLFLSDLIVITLVLFIASAFIQPVPHRAKTLQPMPQAGDQIYN